MYAREKKQAWMPSSLPMLRDLILTKLISVHLNEKNLLKPEAAFSTAERGSRHIRAYF